MAMFFYAMSSIPLEEHVHKKLFYPEVALIKSKSFDCIFLRFFIESILYEIIKRVVIVFNNELILAIATCTLSTFKPPLL